jgi:hypothetical protein
MRRFDKAPQHVKEQDVTHRFPDQHKAHGDRCFRTSSTADFLQQVTFQARKTVPPARVLLKQPHHCVPKLGKGTQIGSELASMLNTGNVENDLRHTRWIAYSCFAFALSATTLRTLGLKAFKGEDRKAHVKCSKQIKTCHKAARTLFSAFFVNPKAQLACLTGNQ